MEMRKDRLRKIEELLQQSPDDLFLLYAIGMEYLSHSDLQGAAEQFRKVLTKDPLHIPSHYQLALILRDQGNEAEAKTLVTEGLRLANEKKEMRNIREFTALLQEFNDV